MSYSCSSEVDSHRRKVSVLRWVVFLSAVLGILWMAPAGYADSEAESRNFIESSAAAIYNLAWPTATYKGVSIKGVEEAVGGYDLLVKLEGESAFGGELWLLLAFEWRDGGISDMRVHGHNAILSPPFKTVENMGALLKEVMKELNSEDGSGASAGGGS